MPSALVHRSFLEGSGVHKKSQGGFVVLNCLHGVELCCERQKKQFGPEFFQFFSTWEEKEPILHLLVMKFSFQITCKSRGNAWIEGVSDRTKPNSIVCVTLNSNTDVLPCWQLLDT